MRHSSILLLLVSLMTIACQGALREAGAGDIAWGSRWSFEEFHLGASELSSGAEGALVTQVLRPAADFDRVFASWNADAPLEGAFMVELRVGDLDGWSDWLWLGDWGELSSGPGDRAQACARGKVDVDVFVASRALDRLQLRLQGVDGNGAPQAPNVQRLDLCLRSTQLGRLLARPTPSLAMTALKVPSLSQSLAPPDLAARICSPTSVAMLLGFHGLPQAPEVVAARAFDPWHDLYGNWPRSIQSAWSLGLPGYLTCFSRWAPLEKMVRSGRPVVISIKAAPGELVGAPYASTAGHLLVIVGFDGLGGVIVNDPAAPGRGSVRRVYNQAQLGRAWFGHGGVAYVMAPGLKPG